MVVSTKAGIAIGFAAPIEFLVLYSIAAASDNEYTFFENYLSDLGVGPGAWAFNSALVITGLLLLLFAILGMGRILGNQISAKVGKLLLAFCGLLMVGIGVFNENYEPYHLIFSLSFFLTFLFALIAITVALYQTGALGRVGVIASGVACAFGFALLPMRGNPQSETLAVIAMMAWGLLISGLAMLKEYGHRTP